MDRNEVTHPLSGFRPQVAERIVGACREAKGTRRVAVFDFDNTCIWGDIGELFGYWLIEKMAYRYDLDEFWSLVDAIDGRDEIRGMIEELEGVDSDDDAYTSLYAQYRAEMTAIYPRKLLREGKAAAYAWAVRLHVGLREDEMAEMSHSCVLREWARPAGTHVFSTLRDERLVVETGIRPFAAIRQAMRYLDHSGFEVWIVSATNTWTVEVAASLLFGISPDRVVGNRVTTRGDELTSELVEPALFRAGKVGAIERDIGARPAIVFGDSETDLDMLEWASNLAVVIDHGDDIVRDAAERHDWAVQPRDELERIEAPRPPGLSEGKSGP